VNYAVYVKKYMPLWWWDSCTISDIIQYNCFMHVNKWNLFVFYSLDMCLKKAYIILHRYFDNDHYEQKVTKSNTSQTSGPAQSSPRTRAGPLVRERHVLRSTRYRASEVRNASISADRWSIKGRRCHALRDFSTDILPSRGRLYPSRAGRSDTSTTGSQGCSQTRYATHALYRDSAGARPPQCQPIGRTHFGTIRDHRSPPQHRTGHCQEKKTLIPPGFIHLPSDALKTYETLRTCAMGGGGIRSCLTAVIYHGLLQGLMLIAARSMPIQQQRHCASGTLPSPPLDSALVQVLANMVLQSQPEVLHVY